MLPQNFKVALVGSSCEESRKIIDIEGDSVDDANENGSDHDSENEDSPVVSDNVPDDMAETDKIFVSVTSENCPIGNVNMRKYLKVDPVTGIKNCPKIKLCSRRSSVNSRPK